MSKILFVAENYAFGPIGKLLTIADSLKGKGHEMVFAGYGTSLQLAKSYSFDEVHEIDTDDKKYRRKLKEVISSVDVLISSMDLNSIVVAKKLEKLTIYIDCLFWYWGSIPEELFNVDLYIREKSITDKKDKENEDEYKSKIINLFGVAPIVPMIKTAKRKRQAIISYGGGEAAYSYKVGRDTDYPTTMTDILHKYVDWTSFDRVIVATGEHILVDLSNKFRDSIFEFTNCSSHAGFLKEMSQSEIILTTTGLVTTQEAFQSKTPLIFLPPSNDCHYLLLDELREQIKHLSSVHLSDFMNPLNLRGKSEEVKISEVLNQLRKLEESPNLQSKIGKKINKLVATRKKWSKSSAKENLDFVQNLGKNGAIDAANKINQLLSSRA